MRRMAGLAAAYSLLRAHLRIIVDNVFDERSMLLSALRSW